jgi:hypothetical protein
VCTNAAPTSKPRILGIVCSYHLISFVFVWQIID